MIVYLEFPVQVVDCHQVIAAVFEVSSIVKFFFSFFSHCVYVVCVPVCVCMFECICGHMCVQCMWAYRDIKWLKWMAFLGYSPLSSLRWGLSVEPRTPS